MRYVCIRNGKKLSLPEAPVQIGRREITAFVTESVSAYWRERLFSCHTEIGLSRRGRKRADILALNMKGELVVIEVKSCLADFYADKKWKTYLPHCNKFYFAVPIDLWMQKQTEFEQAIKGTGAGVIAVSPAGSCVIVSRARTSSMDSGTSNWLLIKMAWRGGSHRDKKRRRRR